MNAAAAGWRAPPAPAPAPTTRPSSCQCLHHHHHSHTSQQQQQQLPRRRHHHQPGVTTPSGRRRSSPVLLATGSGGGGGSQPPPPPPPGGDSNELQPPPQPQQQQALALLLAALSGALLVAVAWLARSTGSLQRAVAVIEGSLEGMADGESTRESVAALKRLLREVFAEQLSLKQRLTAAEKAASTQLEAGDDYALQRCTGDRGDSWARAPVRFSGQVSAAGVLPWSQEADGAAAVSGLAALGASGAADMRVQLHSVLAGGKRRLTAELSQDGTAAGGLKLQRLLYRVQAADWLQLMVAPLGGSLEVFGRSSITPVPGDFGCTPTVRQGHGLTALQQSGSGKALCLSTKRHLSATAGFFVGGSSKAGVSHLQLRGQDGKSLSLVAAHSRPRGCSTHPHQQQQQQQHDSSAVRQRLRFLGVQSPQQQQHSSSSSIQQPAPSGVVLGAAGVLPLGDVVTATAWAERQHAAGSSPAWGVGLYVQPDRDGVELALGLGQATPWRQQQQGGTGGGAPRSLFCELSAKVPAGEGLSISPCAVLTRGRGGASSVAWVMQSTWRF